jgi:hypothetical protein
MTYVVNNYRTSNRLAEALFLAQRSLRNAVVALVLAGLSSLWR